MYKTKGRTTFRYDTNANGTVDRIFVVNRNDESAIYRHWEPGKYDPECSTCWLGFTHSEEYHARNVQDAE